MKTLETTKVAKDFANVVARVYSRRQSFTIVKKGVRLAYLVPVAEGDCNSHDFAEDLAGVALSRKDRRQLASAIRKGRGLLKPLKRPWG